MAINPIHEKSVTEISSPPTAEPAEPTKPHSERSIFIRQPSWLEATWLRLFGKKQPTAQIVPQKTALPALEPQTTAPQPLPLPTPPKKPSLTRPQLIQRLQADQNLDGFDLSHADLRGLERDHFGPLQHSLMMGTRLDRQALQVMIKEKSRVINAYYHEFSGVNLARADLRGLSLDYCDFRGANLDSARLRGASLEGVILSQTELRWVELDARTIETIKDSRTRLGPDGLHDFRDIDLSGQDLSGADLSRLDLRETNLAESRLGGANLSTSRLDTKNIWQIIAGGSRLIDGQHDLRDTDLSSLSLFILPELDKINLRGAKLSGALMNVKSLADIISGQSRLQDGGFHDFAGIDLKGIDLRGVNLQKLDLKGANFNGTILGRAEVEGLILSGTRLRADGLHDLREVNLKGADLRGLDLSTVNLIDADLTGTKFDARSLNSLAGNGSRLSAQSLQNFRGIDLSATDLTQLDLVTLDLEDANLSDAQFTTAQVVTHILHRLALSSALPNQSKTASLKELSMKANSLRATSLRATSLRELSHFVEGVWESVANLLAKLSLPEFFQIASLIPDVKNNLPTLKLQLIKNAIMIAKVMDGDEYGPFRTAIHTQPRDRKTDAIDSYLDMAKRGVRADGTALGADQDAMLELLNESLILNLPSTGVHFGNELSLEEIMEQTQKTREQFASADTAGKIKLVRLARFLDSRLDGKSALDCDAEIYSALQAEKMAAIIIHLYGCGYGKRAWLELGHRLLKLAQNWQQQTALDNRAELDRSAVLLLHMVEEVKDAFHNMFDGPVSRYAEEWSLPAQVTTEFSRNIYRLGPLFQLGLHLAALKADFGGRTTVSRVLEILDREPLNQPLPYFARFFDDEAVDDDVRILGGKGRSLRLLTRHQVEGRYEVPIGFTLPPLLFRNGHLSPQQESTIRDSLKELEKRTMRHFASGSLRVSARSGASVSMPGMMETALNLDSIPAVIGAVERVYRSWDSERSWAFRQMNGIPDDWGTAVSIVEMINGEKDANSGSGVVTSHSPDGHAREIIYSYGQQVTGEEVVANRHAGDSPLPEGMVQELRRIVRFWERKTKYPVELEFTIEAGTLYLLQLRRARPPYEDEVRWVHAMVEAGRMTRPEGIHLLGGARRLKEARLRTEVATSGMELILAKEVHGIGAPLAGRIVLDHISAESLMAEGASTIYVTDDPDAGNSYETILLVGAALTSGGNPLSHLAVVATEQNMSYMSSAPLIVEPEKKTVMIGNEKIHAGDWLTMDPAQGRVYRGEIPIKQGVSPVAELIDSLLEESSDPEAPAPKNFKGASNNPDPASVRPPHESEDSRGKKSFAPTKPGSKLEPVLECCHRGRGRQPEKVSLRNQPTRSARPLSPLRSTRFSLPTLRQSRLRLLIRYTRP